jgi:hypothetical protein
MESPPVPAVPVQPVSVAEVNYTVEDAERALAKHMRLLTMLRKHVVLATRSEDWIDVSGNGTSIMLEGAGAERLLAFVPGEKRLEILSVKPESSERPDVPFKYVVTGNASFQLPGFPKTEITGLRAGRSADKFFQSGASQEGQSVDEIDVMSAAQSAWLRRAISTLLGLRGLSMKDLEEIAGAEFVARTIRVRRRQSDVEKPVAPLVGTETDEQMKESSKAHQAVWARLSVLSKDRKHWPILLAHATHDPAGKFPDRRTVLDMTEKAAGYAAAKVQAIGPMEAVEILAAAGVKVGEPAEGKS